MVMDTGAEHEIRQRLAWDQEAEVHPFLKDARDAGDNDGIRLAEYELDRRGIEI